MTHNEDFIPFGTPSDTFSAEQIAEMCPHTMDDLTVREARELLLQQAQKPSAKTRCYLCGEKYSITNRNIGRDHAVFLWRLVVLWKREPKWYTNREVFTKFKGPKCATDAPYLTMWGLLHMGNAEDHRPKGGVVKPTRRSVSFVENKIQVPSSVLAWPGKRPLHWNEELVYHRDDINKYFDYDELWKKVSGE